MGSKLMAFLILAVSSVPALAKDVILQIAFPDTISISDSWVKKDHQKLVELYPGAKILSVQIPTSRIFNDEVAKNKELAARLAHLNLSPDDKIRMMLIATHGGTNTEKDETILANIGKIRESSVSAELQKLFQPILPWVASDLHVVLQSCNTFCGTDVSSNARAEALLNALHAPNGTLFGATTPVSAMGVQVDKKRIRNWGLIIAAATYLNYLHLVNGDPATFQLLSDLDVAMSLGKSMLTYLGGAIVFESLVRPLVVKKDSRSGSTNFGKLFELENGKVKKVTPVSLAFDSQQILALASTRCNSLLSSP